VLSYIASIPSEASPQALLNTCSNAQQGPKAPILRATRNVAPLAIPPRTVPPVLPSDLSFIVCFQEIDLQSHPLSSGKSSLSYQEHLRLLVSPSHATLQIAVTHLVWILRDLDSMMDHPWHFTIATGQGSRGRLHLVEVRRKRTVSFRI
jgi:hypothetical protein